MHRSSETVAALATALAKAQGELVNPEKSLVATIYVNGRGEGQRTFRYAPLSSGLEIIRKTLGRHEIATVQTTAIDLTAGMVNLTTVLAHTSGEWIASDWPVCPLSDTASPRRMGAALTYARRYALFTLVGIAGEDDIDAPDLNDGTDPKVKDRASHRLQTNGRKPVPVREVLDAEKSAVLRDLLLSELAGLTSPDEGTTWARNILKAKNSLTHEDATLIEKAFEAKYSELNQASDTNDLAASLVPETKPFSRSKIHSKGRNRGNAARSIDKSKLTFGEPRRYRNKAHLQFVASQSCLICGRQPADAHHLKFAQPRALGRKVSDEFTVPLCRTHHRELHRTSNEPGWWETHKIAPLPMARKLWRQSRGSSETTPVDVVFGKTKPKIANKDKSIGNDTLGQVGTPIGDQNAKPILR